MSKLYGSNDKIFLVARRVTIQGVGKTFTNHFLRQPGGLSAQLWAQ